MSPDMTASTPLRRDFDDRSIDHMAGGVDRLALQPGLRVLLVGGMTSACSCPLGQQVRRQLLLAAVEAAHRTSSTGADLRSAVDALLVGLIVEFATL
jgi:hypothetical protein